MGAAGAAPPRRAQRSRRLSSGCNAFGCCCQRRGALGTTAPCSPCLPGLCGSALEAAIHGRGGHAWETAAAERPTLSPRSINLMATFLPVVLSSASCTKPKVPEFRSLTCKETRQGGEGCGQRGGKDAEACCAAAPAAAAPTFWYFGCPSSGSGFLALAMPPVAMAACGGRQATEGGCLVGRPPPPPLLAGPSPCARRAASRLAAAVPCNVAPQAACARA